MIVEKENGQPVIICDTCKRIRSYKELHKGSGASEVFVPESDLTSEEQLFRCVQCTQKLGVIEPSQNVKKEMCCGKI